MLYKKKLKKKLIRINFFIFFSSPLHCHYNTIIQYNVATNTDILYGMAGMS